MSALDAPQTCDLLDLIPQSREAPAANKTMLLNVLKLSQVMVQELIAALEDFYIHKNYHHFDPHVGDTACQIRAGYVLALSKCAVDLRLINNRITQLQELYILLSELYWKVVNRASFKLFKQERLSGFFEKNGLQLEIKNNEKMLLFSKLLTRLKEGLFGNTSLLNQKYITNLFCCSLNQASHLLKLMERYVANQSINYIFGLLIDFDSSLYKLLIKKDDKDRQLLACFYASKAVWHSLIKNQERLVIIVYDKDNQFEPIVLAFGGNGQDDFIAMEPSWEEPAFVMFAETEFDLDEPGSRSAFLKVIQQRGLLTILNAYMASHPQYSGTKLQRYRDDPFIGMNHPSEPMWRAELKAYQQLALQIGCCDANPSFLFVKHALCATPSTALKLLQYRKKHGMEIA